LKLATLRMGETEHACIVTTGGYLPIGSINRVYGKDYPTEVLELIRSGSLAELSAWYATAPEEVLEAARPDLISEQRARLAPLYRYPPKIWGIGLNYAAHAADLSESAPAEIPASFLKPYTSLIGHGDTIEIPRQSERTTAEAELGVILGTGCKDVAPEHWLEVIAGFTCVIDMTAEDILRRNPRYLTLSKSFDTFFSFGPFLLTPDEVNDLPSLSVKTVINGRVHAENIVANMTFSPDKLVSFHSQVMTLLPGDVISTGTPGAVPIADGDRVECRIDGFPALANPVRDRKRL
jgi:2-keto-4-pentenoate hydratase/2-oxohepta-3-ene-1,7-dioic acid hydratase in catechol pathway